MSNERRKSFKKVSDERVGETRINNFGSKMWIIEYVNSHNITVQFEDGYVAKGRCYLDFKNGKIKSPYDKSIFGNGFIGEGKYNCNDIQYQYWRDMIRRCYDKKFHEKEPIYKDVLICEEWHNFQNFAKWFDENYYEVENQTMQLDKDILCKGNKIYSPDTCIFVPNRINSLFIKHTTRRGDCPIGVSYKDDIDKYYVKVRYFNYETNKSVQKSLGFFDDKIRAFEKYKMFKENHIKDVAEIYKDVIPKDLYNAMYDYVVEIND